MTAAHLWVPPGRRGSYGDEVADLALEFGRPPDAEQRIALDAINSYGPGGRWHALEAVVIEPRQNGKTGGIVLPTVLADLVLWPDRDRVAWTSHRMKTSRETFEDTKRLIDGCSLLSRRVDRISETNGEECVDFVNGSRLDFLARANGSGRGLGGRTVVIDEALFMTATMAGDLLPILAARENPRVIYASSAAKATSDQLHALVRRGRAGGDASLILVEHCAAGTLDAPGCERDDCSHEYGVMGCALDDEDLWRAANPAMESGRIGVMFLRAMRRTLTWREFAREFLGWHEAPADAGRISVERWRALAEATSKPERLPVGIAVDTTRGLRSSVVAAVAPRADGRVHGEILAARAGYDWLPGFLAPLCRELRASVRVLGGSSTAQAVIPMLERARVKVVETTLPDYAAACGLVTDDVTSGRWVHLGDPLTERAVEAVTTVPVGDGGAFRWSPEKSTGDVAPLVGLTLARWQLEVDPQAVYDIGGSVG